MRNFLIWVTLIAYSVSKLAYADIKNPVGFIGQTILGSTTGAPLTVDVNNGLVSGEPTTTFVGVAGSTSVATNAAYATINSLTITPTFAGTYQVHCRAGSVTHSTNNASALLAVHVAGTIVSDSIASVIPFIQGGVTPSLSVPMVLYTNSEVTITAGQAITCGWRTTAGTVVSPNSRSILVTRVR